MLVLVESDHPVDEGGLRGDEPDDERQRREEGARDDRPARAIGHGLTGAGSQSGTAVAPGPRFLEGRRGGQGRSADATAANALLANRQSVLGTNRRHG